MTSLYNYICYITECTLFPYTFVDTQPVSCPDTICSGLKKGWLVGLASLRCRVYLQPLTAHQHLPFSPSQKSQPSSTACSLSEPLDFRLYLPTGSEEAAPPPTLLVSQTLNSLFPGARGLFPPPSHSDSWPSPVITWSCRSFPALTSTACSAAAHVLPRVHQGGIQQKSITSEKEQFALLLSDLRTDLPKSKGSIT